MNPILSQLARAAGIEPTLELLESSVLPLYYARKLYNKNKLSKLLGFFVNSMLLTMNAKLFKF